MKFKEFTKKLLFSLYTKMNDFTNALTENWDASAELP